MLNLIINTITLCGACKITDGTNMYNATVPGTVQGDLLKLGEIKDYFYGLNEHEIYQLEDNDYTYCIDFNHDCANFDKAELVFEGIDTFGDIFLNDELIGNSKNMFISHVFDVTGKLNKGKNTLRVQIKSAKKMAEYLQAQYGNELQPYADFHRCFVRKAHYGFGWDWGPTIVTAGIWRPVYINYIKDGALKDIYAYTKSVSSEGAVLKLSCIYDGACDDVDAVITINGEKVAAKKLILNDGVFEGEVIISEPHLWYPNGMGEQPLYNVEFYAHNEGVIIDQNKIKIGLRTIRIIQENDDDELGSSFIFEINGLKVFAKGACWIPAHNLLPDITVDDYKKYIKDAKDANMNMLRVWGGGIYEDTAFYEACDEAGIMVWQDFMYACSQYPDDKQWFCELAESEAKFIVKQLRNHPSIVLWCGNNENNWFYELQWGLKDPDYYGNYIYKTILPNICKELDLSRPYHISSPYGGEEPNSENFGDRHNWLVWSGYRPFEEYKKDKGRFLSEYGFQSLPAKKTVYSYTEPQDRNMFSQVMLSHNKQIDGTERLMRYLIGETGLPEEFDGYIYLTQYVQALAIKVGTEHWRAQKYRTAGALFWQLNDCWPVASWSCIDFYKRKKALYYYARRFFDIVMPYMLRNENTLCVQIVNDFQEFISGSIRITTWSFNGKKLGEIVKNINVQSDSVEKVLEATFEELGIADIPQINVKNCYPGTTRPQQQNANLLNIVTVAEVIVDNNSYINYMVYDKTRNLKLHQPKIDIKITGNKIRLVSDKPALCVFIETENEVEISDNGLMMEPNHEYIINCSENPGAVNVTDISRYIKSLI